MAQGTRFSTAQLEQMADRFVRGEAELVGEPEVVEAASGTTVMSVRLPRNVIAQLKTLAEDRGVGATTLARDFILDGLVAQSGGLVGSVPVTELLQLVTSYGYLSPEQPEQAPPRSATTARKGTSPVAAMRAAPARKPIKATSLPASKTTKTAAGRSAGTTSKGRRRST